MIITLPDILSHVENSRDTEVKYTVCDRGYRGKKTFSNTKVILPLHCAIIRNEIIVLSEIKRENVVEDEQPLSQALVI